MSHTPNNVDPIGELVAVYNQVYNENIERQSLGATQRLALGAVERIINGRWLDNLPPGALMCGCGDIVDTDYQCENCNMVNWRPE